MSFSSLQARLWGQEYAACCELVRCCPLGCTNLHYKAYIPCTWTWPGGSKFGSAKHVRNFRFVETQACTFPGDIDGHGKINKFVRGTSSGPVKASIWVQRWCRKSGMTQNLARTVYILQHPTQNPNCPSHPTPYLQPLVSLTPASMEQINNPNWQKITKRISINSFNQNTDRGEWSID